MSVGVGMIIMVSSGQMWKLIRFVVARADPELEERIRRNAAALEKKLRQAKEATNKSPAT